MPLRQDEQREQSFCPGEFLGVGVGSQKDDGSVMVFVGVPRLAAILGGAPVGINFDCREDIEEAVRTLLAAADEAWGPKA